MMCGTVSYYHKSYCKTQPTDL